MNNKIIGLIIVLVIIIAGGIIIHQVYGGQPEQQEIIIGAILPLTGKLAPYAQDAQRGIDLALAETDLPVKVIYEDHKYEPKEGITAYKRLRVEDIKLFITGSSNVSLALSPLVNEEQTIQMAVFSSISKYTSPDDYTFRVTPRAELENKALVNSAITNGLTRVSIIYPNNEWGQGHYNTIKSEFERLGGEILIAENYLKGDADFRSQLIKLKSSQPQAIVLIAAGKDGGVIMKQAKELDINQQFLGVRAIENSDLLEIAKGSAEGIIYPYNFDGNSDNPVIQNFISKYQEKYNEIPSAYVAEGYTAMSLLLKSLDSCNVDDTQCVKNDLLQTRDYQGGIGNLSFDQNGDVLIEFFMKTVKDGQFVRYE